MAKWWKVLSEFSSIQYLSQGFNETSAK